MQGAENRTNMLYYSRREKRAFEAVRILKVTSVGTYPAKRLKLACWLASIYHLS